MGCLVTWYMPDGSPPAMAGAAWAVAVVVVVAAGVAAVVAGVASVAVDPMSVGEPALAGKVVSVAVALDDMALVSDAAIPSVLVGAQAARARASVAAIPSSLVFIIISSELHRKRWAAV